MNRSAPRFNDLESPPERRFTARLLRLVKSVQPRVRTDRVVLIGGTAEQAATIQLLYGQMNVRHYNPPLGSADDPAAFEECVRFVESQSPFRFCFLAVESPQQEALASLLRDRGIARGLKLCVRTSPNFLTGGVL
jgi:N-acetylglucosaminyldiphosphoundecaprenol N-acetyl-beta-D-mannosaminyltransferase